MSNLSRRQVLASVAGVGMVSVAGCSVDVDDTLPEIVRIEYTSSFEVQPDGSSVFKVVGELSLDCSATSRYGVDLEIEITNGEKIIHTGETTVITRGCAVTVVWGYLVRLSRQTTAGISTPKATIRPTRLLSEPTDAP